MLSSLKNIFEEGTIEINKSGDRIPLHSATPMEQGIFLQSIFDIIKPRQSLEVGLAYGISALFILEKHKEIGSNENAHIAIEPDEYWGEVALHNIEKEGLLKYIEVKKGYSDDILPGLHGENRRIQYAYIDTTKRFDVVLHDFYFIDKILDINGTIIFDDCNWSGIQRVVRFVNTLPNYKVIGKFSKVKRSLKSTFIEKIITILIFLIPFKGKYYPTLLFKTAKELGLNYRCIAFQKVAEDSRNWDWDNKF